MAAGSRSAEVAASARTGTASAGQTLIPQPFPPDFRPGRPVRCAHPLLPLYAGPGDARLADHGGPGRLWALLRLERSVQPDDAQLAAPSDRPARTGGARDPVLS